MQKEKRSSSRSSEARIINKFIPPYRDIKLFTRERTITSDFNFFEYVQDIYGEAINRKLSNRNFTSTEELIDRFHEKGHSFHDSVFTHSLGNWSCDHRLLWLSRALINGHEYTIMQWESSFIFIKDSEAYDAILNEGCMDLFQYIRRLQ